MCEYGIVASRISQRTIVECEAIGIDADTIWVGLTRLDDIDKQQVCGTATGSIVGLHRRIADLKANLWCT